MAAGRPAGIVAQAGANPQAGDAARRRRRRPALGRGHRVAASHLRVRADTVWSRPGQVVTVQVQVSLRHNAGNLSDSDSGDDGRGRGTVPVTVTVTVTAAAAALAAPWPSPSPWQWPRPHSAWQAAQRDSKSEFRGSELALAVSLAGAAGVLP
jgi:hypothetical protein